MRTQETSRRVIHDEDFPSSYREVKIGRTYYCVTSMFTGEIELGPTLEKLAAQQVLRDMDKRSKDILRTGSNCGLI